jgi:hypothetical protein
LDNWSWGCSHEETCNEALRLAKTLFYDRRPPTEEEEEEEEDNDNNLEDLVPNNSNGSQLSLNVHGYDETTVKQSLLGNDVVYYQHDDDGVDGENNNNNSRHRQNYWRIEATYTETTLAEAIKEVKSMYDTIDVNNDYPLLLLLTAPGETPFHIAEIEVSKKYHGQPRQIVARQLITFNTIDGSKRVIATCLD